MTAEKDVQVARKKGRGRGGEGIWAMPERKHFFFHEGFPYVDMSPGCYVGCYVDMSPCCYVDMFCSTNIMLLNPDTCAGSF